MAPRTTSTKVQKKPTEIGASDRAVAAGRRIARLVFQKRGCRASTRLGLSERELATLLTFAYDLGEQGGEAVP
jgi:hypothetical protein